MDKFRAFFLLFLIYCAYLVFFKSYNKKSDYKDYDSLNLFNLKTTTPISGDNKVTNILDIIFKSFKEYLILTSKIFDR